MAEEHRPAHNTLDTAGGVLGLLVFLAGIAMIVFTFTQVRGIFDGIDAQMMQVRIASQQAQQQAASTPPSAGAEAGDQANPGTVTVSPGQGPSFADVGITIGLKLLGLLVLGWLGALVASKGAHLAGAHRGKRE